MLNMFSTKNAEATSGSPANNRRFLSRVFALGAFAVITALVPPMASAGDEKLREKVDFPSVRLNKHEHGDAAIRALGSKLPDVAKWYHKTPEEFSKTLRNDRAARIDRDGRMFFVEETATPQQGTATGGTDATVSGALLPLDQTFRLHSRPGAQRVIYLDFNGYVATGTAWNSAYGISAIDAPPFDLDGDPTTFSTTELQRIQYIWQRVAEDYAPFDVDVTTEEPLADALTRTSASDLTFGTRAVITKDWTANTANPCNCGGFAYVGVFDDTTEFYKPAYIFYNNLGAGHEKYVSEAISHEVGHNLGLSHDGTTTGTAYYAGHGSGATGWAPIMGVGYYQSLVQWSKGEYPNANNTEDDLARIPLFGVPLRADDHGDTFATATQLTASTTAGVTTLRGDGVISSRADVDMFQFSSGPGAMTLNVNSAARSPNLDLSASVYDANGVLLATSNPVDTLNAAIVVNSPATGTYYLKVDGVGKGDLATGYSDYASLGQYVISGSVTAADSQPPVALAAATPTSGTGPLTVNFSSVGSYDPDGSAITYSWNFGDGSAVSIAANPTHVYAAGNFTATLTVTDASGAATTASVLIKVTANQAPIALASATPTSGTDPLTVNFSSAGSYDPEGGAIAYKWNFGDGSVVSTAANPTHVYAAGNFTATLTVTDAAGLATTASVLIKVTANQAPIALASATPTSGTDPLTVNFSSAGSYDPDGSAITYKWNFGDGSAVSTAANPAHVYTAGSYTATLTVTDASGLATAASLLITVTPKAAVTVHVEKISMSLLVKRNGINATAAILITNASGNVISGATVSGNWSGVVSGAATATTNRKGLALVKSPATKSRGTFTFTVTGVSFSGASYDAAQNKLTSNSIVY